MKLSKILTIFLLAIVMMFIGCGSDTLTVSLVYEDGTTYKTVEVNPLEDVNLEEPSKEGFIFLGWYDGDIKVISPVKFNDDITLVAKFKSLTEEEYTYKFIVDGKVVKELKAKYGTEIEYPNDPVKESTSEYTYEFTGWDKDIKVLTEDITFNANFNEVAREYTYKFIADGKVVKELKAKYGTEIEYPNDPVKESTEKYNYEFTGWDKDIKVLTEDITFNAIFKEVAKPIESLEGLRISFLGDSITTFYKEGSEMNSYYGGDNQFYYPIYSSTIKTVDLTWWAKLLNNTKMVLGVNNSWSGSCAFGTGVSAGCSDNRINTINENGNPDIVIVYLGTNDLVNGFTTAQFRSAIEMIINKVNAKVDAKIFLTTLGYTTYSGYNYTEEGRLAYNEELRKIAEEKDCGVIPLDEYIINDNYMIYLGDGLHYNAKGANLLSLIAEKAITESFGLTYDKEIEVEHQEILPEGVIAKITATADDSVNFWAEYANKIFFTSKNKTSAPFSLRLQISKDATSGKYYVISIHQSGENTTYNCDYLLQISELYVDYHNIKTLLKDVKVGSIVEFDESASYPKEILIKEGDGGYQGPSQEPEQKPDVVEGQLHVGAYNTGIWTLYESTVFIYSANAIDKASTYINFYVIKLTKNTSDDNYTITGLKPYQEVTEYSACDYYVLIYNTLDEVSYFKEAKIGDTVIIHGDVTTGNVNLEFKK